jgi:hypothetical protein
VLGIVVNGFPFGLGAPISLATLRIPGVLQRIALCYVAVSLLLLTTSPRTQLIWSVSLLALYWGAVSIHLKEGLAQGNTAWRPGGSEAPHEVAIGVDPEAFFRHYLSVVQSEGPHL